MGKKANEPKAEAERMVPSSSTPQPKPTLIAGRKIFLTAPGGIRIVELPSANHYLFLSNPDDVIRELKVFLTGLR
ncbi:MAG TPA: hypothetical protein VI636_02660 [Candidatus Angelobacter sp.]